MGRASTYFYDGNNPDKQTLHRKLLFEQADAESRKRLESIFGSSGISQDDLSLVRELLESTGVLSRIASQINELSAQAAGRMDMG